MVLIRIVIIIIAIYFYFFNFRLVFEWILIRMNRINLEVIIYLDWVRLIFVRVVLIISSIVLIYRIEYIRNEININRYYLLVLIFVLSIILIIISPNLVRIIFGWDGLGLVSFCLVIYYQNYMSYNSGILTVLINRVGDVILLIIIGIVIIMGRWNIFILKKINLIIFFLIIAGITKRAQIPFSVWLPRAMAAPTPVSALVHSSTLVTAGVYLLIRFNKFIILRKFREILIILSILTIFISGLMAIFEFDLKKIIALSTLRQLGLIIIILRVGYPILSYYHLLTHAIFKSLLFISAGVIIHRIGNNQDIRLIGNLIEFIPFTIYSFTLTLLALRGFPFLSGFYSKDLVIEIIYYRNFNVIILLIALISLIFTLMYSIRLVFYSFFNEIKFIIKLINENRLINKSIIILIIFRVLIGSILNWIFFFDRVIYLRIFYKLLTLIIIIIGVILIYIIKNKIFNYYLYYFFGYMWFLVYLFYMILKPLLIISLISYQNEKVWIEYFSKIFFINLFIDRKSVV